MANVSSEASEVKEEEEFCEYCKNKGIEVEAQALYRGIPACVNCINRLKGLSGSKKKSFLDMQVMAKNKELSNAKFKANPVIQWETHKDDETSSSPPTKNPKIFGKKKSSTKLNYLTKKGSIMLTGEAHRNAVKKFQMMAGEISAPKIYAPRKPGSFLLSEMQFPLAGPSSNIDRLMSVQAAKNANLSLENMPPGAYSSRSGHHKGNMPQLMKTYSVNRQITSFRVLEKTGENARSKRLPSQGRAAQGHPPLYKGTSNIIRDGKGSQDDQGLEGYQQITQTPVPKKSSNVGGHYSFHELSSPQKEGNYTKSDFLSSSFHATNPKHKERTPEAVKMGIDSPIIHNMEDMSINEEEKSEVCNITEGYKNPIINPGEEVLPPTKTATIEHRRDFTVKNKYKHNPLTTPQSPKAQESREHHKGSRKESSATVGSSAGSAVNKRESSRKRAITKFLEYVVINSKKQLFKDKLLYESDDNNINEEEMHNLCDGKGSLLFLFHANTVSSDPITIGAYTEIGWIKEFPYLHDNKCGCLVVYDKAILIHDFDSHIVNNQPGLISFGKGSSAFSFDIGTLQFESNVLLPYIAKKQKTEPLFQELFLADLDSLEFNSLSVYTSIT